MKHTKHLLSSLFVAALVLGGWASAQAQTEITLRAPLPMKESFEQLLPKFEMKTGVKVNATYGTGVGTKQEAAKGDPYDVFVILPPYEEALNSGNLVKKDGKIVGAFILAITVKKGSPLPDISSAAAVKKDLLDAKALVTVDPTMGSVGVATNACLKKLNILDQVQSKVKYVPNGGGVGKSVLDGTSDIGLGPYVSDLKGQQEPRSHRGRRPAERCFDSDRHFHRPSHQGQGRQSRQGTGAVPGLARSGSGLQGRRDSAAQVAASASQFVRF